MQKKSATTAVSGNELIVGNSRESNNNFSNSNLAFQSINDTCESSNSNSRLTNDPLINMNELEINNDINHETEINHQSLIIVE